MLLLLLVRLELLWLWGYGSIFRLLRLLLVQMLLLRARPGLSLLTGGVRWCNIRLRRRGPGRRI